MAPAEAQKLVIVRWLLDTRFLWPRAVKTHQLSQHAARALVLLTPDERDRVLLYYHVRDAKMALASHLLKHSLICKYHAEQSIEGRDLSWWETSITRNGKGKPIYVDKRTGTSPIVFNVSHQAGLVALVAAYYDTNADNSMQVVVDASDIDIGVDIVCVNERQTRDNADIYAHGWYYFVNTYSDVLAPSEVSHVAFGLPAEFSIDEKRRTFYALWCLREAYVKMTGDALLADWLKELEFRQFRVPLPAESETGQEQMVDEFDIWWKGGKVKDVRMELRSWGRDYMLGSAVRTRDGKNGSVYGIGEFTILDMDDILSFAESRIPP